MHRTGDSKFADKVMANSRGPNAFSEMVLSHNQSVTHSQPDDSKSCKTRHERQVPVKPIPTNPRVEKQIKILEQNCDHFCQKFSTNCTKPVNTNDHSRAVFVA